MDKKIIYLYESDKKDEKFKVVVDGKTIHFGSAEMSDFTIHKDPERKERYLKRHIKNEDWNNIKTAGFFSRWLLWNLPTLNKSIKDTENRFNIKIVRKR